MLLDWLLKTEEGNISYKELKMSAHDRSGSDMAVGPFSVT